MKKAIPAHHSNRPNENAPRSSPARVSPSGISALSADFRKLALPRGVDLLFTLKYRR